MKGREEIEDPSTIGLILISTFLILIGTFTLTTFSSNHYTPFSYIGLLISICYILTGWGLLTNQRWALLVGVILTGVPSSFSVYSLFYIVYLIHQPACAPLFFTFLLSLGLLPSFLYLVYKLVKSTP